MAVTVTGASTLTYFVNDAFVSGNLGTISTLDSSSLNLLLLAYDTRDSSSLLTVNTIDNKFSGALCGSLPTVPTPLCVGPPLNSIPVNDGTEFIVLQIQNNSLNSIFLQNIMINGVDHSWDSSTSTILLDASVDYLGSTDRPYPADGMFSILPIEINPTQNENIEIQNGQTVNILIKLGPEDSVIKLNKGIHVLFNFGEIQPVEFLINSGDAR